MSNPSGKIKKKKYKFDTQPLRLEAGLSQPTQLQINGGKGQRWSFIQSDLTNALNTWNELEKAEVQLSPEQEQLLKIKFIITQLKAKLEQF